MNEINIKRTFYKLFFFTIAMFGFGYALVPLYNAYCDFTGRGKLEGISQAKADKLETESDRLVTVIFDTNVRKMPWDFTAKDFQVKVTPGTLTEATFTITNNSPRPVIGRAIPSLSPAQAGIYFNKTECFCFDEQPLEPGETRDMVVAFIVDTKMPKRFSSVTLSYTFFEIPDINEKVSNKVAEDKLATNNNI